MATRDTASEPKSASHESTEIPLESLPIVELNEREYAIATSTAKIRDLTYDEIDGGSVFGSQSRLQAHLTGVIGELSAAKYFDTLSLEDVDALHTYGDQGWDFRLTVGSLDVKTTETDLEVPDLIVPARPTPSADYYLLVHRISEKRVRIIGVTDRDTVTSRRPERFPGQRANYIVPAEELWLLDR